jgi:hypothetical protein
VIIKLGSLGLSELASAIERALSWVPKSEFVPVTANSTADAPFIVKHRLGVVPKFASAMSSVDGNIYVDSDDLAEWNQTQIKVRHPVANARLIVKIEV